MYSWELDERQGVMIGHHTAGDASSLQEFLRAHQRFVRAQSPLHLPKLEVLVVDRDAPHPAQTDREAIIRVWQNAPHPYVGAMVTTSIVARAMIPVMQLLAGRNSRHQMRVFTQKDDAIRYFDTLRPGCAELFVQMEARRVAALAPLFATGS